MAFSPGANLPPVYKKRLLQGVGAWAVLCVGVAFLVFRNAPHAAESYESRIPHAAAEVKTVYLTPQITDASAVAFDGGADAAALSGRGAYVTLVMTGLGLSEDLTERAITDLPPEAAVAFSPYGDLPRWIREAKEAKREALALLPMEPASYPKDDPGPRALLTRVTAKENEDNLAAVLRDSNGAVGVMNYMGSAFLADRKNLKPVFDTLKKSGAVFVEMAAAPSQAASEVAAAAELPFLSADIRIDADATDIEVGKKLVELENLARSRGYAVGIATPYPVSFNMIKSWAAELGKRGVTMIPLSAMMKVKARHDQSAKEPPAPATSAAEEPPKEP